MKKTPSSSSDLSRARDLSRPPGPKVAEGLLEQTLGVHHERAIPRHGLAVRDTGEQKDPAALRGSHADRLAVTSDRELAVTHGADPSCRS